MTVPAQSCPDCPRLRRQNKEAAERRDREQAEMESRIAQHERSIAEAKRRMRHAEVDWTTDARSQQPDGWWHYTSLNNIAEVVALVEEIDRLRAAVDAAKGDTDGD